MNDKGYALKQAAKNGDAAELTRLMPMYDEHHKSVALTLAAGHGHIECVRLLVPHSDARYNDSQALMWAADNGHTEIVRVLIPVSDPKADHSQALFGAFKNNHTTTIDLLWPVSDVEAAVSRLMDILPRQKELWRHRKKEAQARQENKLLHDSVSITQTVPRVLRKI